MHHMEGACIWYRRGHGVYWRVIRLGFTARYLSLDREGLPRDLGMTKMTMADKHRFKTMCQYNR